MKRWLLFGMAILLAAVLFLPACDSGSGGGGSSNSIVGTWVCTQSDVATNVGNVYTFYANNTGIWNGSPITYVYTGSTLSFVWNGSPWNYALAWLTNVKIQITDTSLGHWMIMVKT